MRNQFIACATLLVLLQSCSTLTPQKASSENKAGFKNESTTSSPISDQITGDSQVTNTANTLQPPEITTPEFGQFSSETLYTLLTAEIAATRQQYSITLSQYVKAANTTGDLGIISRATRLAQYFRNSTQTLNMGRLWIEQAPNDIEAHTLVTSAYLEKRQPLDALNHAEYILAIQNNKSQADATAQQDSESSQDLTQPPNTTRSLKQRAALLETIANFSRTSDIDTREELIRRYHLLDKRYPTLTPIKVALSVLYESKQETEQAFDIVRKAIAQDADYLPAARQEINLLNASGDLEQSLQKLQKQLEKTPNNARIRLLYARTLAQTDIDEAYKEFTLLSTSAPKNLDIKFSRAILALELRKLDEAKKAFIELLNSQYRPNTINYYLGNLSELNKEGTAAINYYLAVKSGDDFVAANTQAARLMANSSQLKNAQAHLKALRKQAPSARAQFFNAEADILDEQGKTPEAISLLNVAIVEYPNNVTLRYTRSSFYEKTDRLPLMEADLQHALALEPENAAILNALGYFLTSRTERHEEALGLITKALNIRPKDAAILDSMGWVLFKLGRIEEAIPHLRQAFKQFPDPEVAAHLGEVLWTNGQQQEALNIWNKNLEENPDDKQIPEAMRRLNAQP